MYVNLQVTIDNHQIPVSYECEDIKHINWNEVMYDIYEQYEDKDFAEQCDDEKFSESQNDKLK